MSNFPVIYYASPDNIQIVNSYNIKKCSNMHAVLDHIIQDIVLNGVDCKVIEERSMGSMIDEWCVHNMLYNLHIMRTRTKDVDINIPNKFFLFLYKVLAIPYRIFH